MIFYFPRWSVLILGLVSFSVFIGCATGSSAGLTEGSAPREHFCSPWRYKHMNHLHTRPWYKDQKPLFPPCSVCAATAKVRPDTSVEGNALLSPPRPETAPPPGTQASLDGSTTADRR
jgi:hypothetical protein